MNPEALGRYLRESREAKEKTLEDAVSALKIRRPILEAFERGDFDVLDTPVQIRGLLRNYAHYLELDEERVLQYYAASLESQRRQRLRQRPSRNRAPVAVRSVTDTQPTLPVVTLTEQRRNRGFGILRLFLVAFVSITAVAIIVFVSYEMLRDSLPVSVADAPADVASAATVLPSATYTASWTPQLDLATEPPNFAAAGIAGVNISIEMLQRSWLRSVVDGAEQFVGIIDPGEELSFSGSESVVITAANAAALRVDFNGQQQEDFGPRGQQVEVRFDLSGITIEGEQASEATPTQTNTPFPTPTPLFADLAPAATDTELPTAASSATPSLTPISTQTPLAQATVTTAVAATTEPTAEPTVISAQPQNSATPTAAASATASSTSAPITSTETVNTGDPIATATATAVLPLRATASDPTPTKALPE